MGKTFVMAGGGTGGHVIPAIAVAKELRSRGHQVLFVGTRRGLEATLVPAEGFAIQWIEIGGLNRVGLRKVFTSLLQLPVSVWRASRILSKAKADAVFSMGGYVAGPVLLAAFLKGTPVVAMEPNAIPGFTHRWGSRFLTRTLVSFEDAQKWFPKGRSEVTGLPVRDEFFALPTKVRQGKLTVLITGGSQGSRTLNRAAEQSWPLWKKDAVKIIHQTGLSSFKEIVERLKESPADVELHPFLSEMPAAFAQADIVVSRAGMGAVSELAAAGKPSILVPLPTAADNHQFHNAQSMQQSGAARMVLDKDLTGERLVQEVMLASEHLEAMGAAARAVAQAGAARRAADVLEEVAA